MRTRFFVFCSLGSLLALFSGLFALDYKVESIRISVNDSTELATDIYLPNDPGPFPCILIRSPYNKEGQKGDGERFTQVGYAVVAQDTRGKFQSDGTFYPFRHERDDGLATVAWIRSQPWSNGKIAGWGGSYVGYTQWAIADKLDAMVPVVTTANMYEALYPAGLFSLATAFNWGLMVDSKTSNPIPADKIIAAYSILPLSVADDSTYKQNAFLDNWLFHQQYDSYWQSMDHRVLHACPMYSIAGWWDIFLMSQIQDFVLSERQPTSRMIVGPYAHGKILTETDYGDNSDLFRNWSDILQFLDSHLKESQPIKWNPFSLFIMHRNEWVESETWPPAATHATAFYFQANGGLAPEKDPHPKSWQYIYDPATPFPSLGGTFLGAGVGPALQNPNSARTDQVVFKSAPLIEPLVLLGPINATLYAATDAPSTNFFVSLQDVDSEGRILNIQEGGCVMLTNDEPQRLDMSLWATGYQIAAGHQLRVSITSSLFPRYNRTLNSAETIFDARTSRPARQRIYVGDEYPSCVVLPIYDTN